MIYSGDKLISIDMDLPLLDLEYSETAADGPPGAHPRHKEQPAVNTSRKVRAPRVV